MKIRKILPLVLLAIGSVFLLSSCDQLLDVIFSNNTITVYASAYEGSWGYNPSTDQMYIYVNGTNTATASYAGSDGSYMYWNYSIPKLSDGTYTVYVNYYHPYGIAPGSYVSPTQTVSLPNNGSHSVNLSFNF